MTVAAAGQDGDMSSCPRCGHNTADDPSGKPDGDHLILASGPMTCDATDPSTKANTFVITAHQNVRFVWCSAWEATYPGETR